MLPGMIVGPIGLPLLIVGFLVLLGIFIFLVELKVLAYAYQKIGGRATLRVRRHAAHAARQPREHPRVRA